MKEITLTIDNFEEEVINSPVPVDKKHVGFASKKDILEYFEF